MSTSSVSCSEPSKKLVITNRSLLNEKYNVPQLPVIHLLFWSSKEKEHLCPHCQRTSGSNTLFFEAYISFSPSFLTDQNLIWIPREKQQMLLTSGSVVDSVNFQCSGYKESQMQAAVKITSQVIVGKRLFPGCVYFGI